MKAALHAVAAFGLCATLTAAFRTSTEVERSEYQGAFRMLSNSTEHNPLHELMEIVEPWVEVGGELLDDQQDDGFLGELVHNARRGNMLEVIGSALEIASIVLESVGFPLVAFFLDLIVAIFFHEQEKSTWDEVKEKVRREIDDALLSYRLDGADDNMQAVNQQLSTSPFYNKLPGPDGVDPMAEYLALQVLDHQLAANWNLYLPPQLHLSSGNPLSTEQKANFIPMAASYYTIRLTLIGKMKVLVHADDDDPMFKSQKMKDHAVALLKEKVAGLKLTVIPTLVVLYYELMEPGKQSYVRRQELTQLMLKFAKESSTCKDYTIEELDELKWKIPNLDECLLAPLLNRTVDDVEHHLWSIQSFTNLTRSCPIAPGRFVDSYPHTIALDGQVCTGGSAAVGLQFPRKAGGKRGISCEKVIKTEGDIIGSSFTPACFGTNGCDSMSSICPDGSFVIGIEIKSGHGSEFLVKHPVALICGSKPDVQVLDSTVFEKVLTTIKHAKESTRMFCELNNMQGVLVGMRCEHDGCTNEADGDVVGICKIITTKAQKRRYELDSNVRPPTLMSYASVPLPVRLHGHTKSLTDETEGNIRLRSLACRIEALEVDTVLPGFCPLLGVDSASSCRSVLIENRSAECNHRGNEPSDSDSDPWKIDWKQAEKVTGEKVATGYSQHFVFKFHHAEENGEAPWTFVTNITKHEEMISYLDRRVCQPFSEELLWDDPSTVEWKFNKKSLSTVEGVPLSEAQCKENVQQACSLVAVEDAESKAICTKLFKQCYTTQTVGDVHHDCSQKWKCPEVCADHCPYVGWIPWTVSGQTYEEKCSKMPEYTEVRVKVSPKSRGWHQLDIYTNLLCVTEHGHHSDSCDSQSHCNNIWQVIPPGQTEAELVPISTKVLENGGDHRSVVAAAERSKKQKKRLEQVLG